MKYTPIVLLPLIASLNAATVAFQVTSSNVTAGMAEASGNLYLGTDLVGSFNLDQIASTNYGNIMFFSGVSGPVTGSEATGIAFEHGNLSGESANSVEWELSVSINPGYALGSIRVGNYLQNSLDGTSNQQNADITLTWVGGAGTLQDPDDVIDIGNAGINGTSGGAIADGATVNSGDLLWISDSDGYQAVEGQWTVTAPTDSLTISYITDRPSAAQNNDAFREQLAFEVDVTAIPETSTLVLSLLGGALLIRRRR